MLLSKNERSLTNHGYQSREVTIFCQYLYSHNLSFVSVLYVYTLADVDNFYTDIKYC